MMSKVSDSIILKRNRCLFLLDNLKVAKVKLSSENNLLESTSFWIKSELKIDANPGLA